MKKILSLFDNLNQKLADKGELAEVGIVGGAVMCLVFHARKATRDIDGIFKPTRLVRDLVAQIAEEEGLSDDWLNDAAKGFVQGNFQRQEVINLSNLRVWAPEPRYMLAMKCVSARWDTSDKDDVQFLIHFLKLKTADSVFAIIDAFYPKKKVPPKTRFLVEEIFEG